MNVDEQDKFKMLVYALTEEYQHKFSEERLRLWWEHFKSFSIEEISNAIFKSMKVCKFMPKISDIYEFLPKQEINFKIRAQYAWNELLKNLSRSSSGDDEVTQCVVRLLGGANNLAMMDERDLRFKEKKFLDLYEELSREDKFKINSLELDNKKMLN